MTAGSTSGPMFVNVVRNNPPNDIMAAWSFQLSIVPEAGTTGTLTFQDPATGTPPIPPSYIFGGNGLGIAATNAGTSLNANDFFDPSVGAGVPVPGTPGANLLQVDFLASSGASGLFGIYALQGAAFTEWTDSSFTTQFFTNVPDGTNLVLVGDVLVKPAAAVPEPSTLALLALGAIALAGRRWRNRQPATPQAGSARAGA